MYAVIETGGKQYKVAPGQIVKVERLPGETEASIEFDKVYLIVKDGQVVCGENIATAKVRGTVLREEKGKKVIAFKYKRRKNYSKKIGHRQKYTCVRIEEILH